MLIEVTKDEYIRAVYQNIKEDYKDARQGVKSPYFLLNYKGTYHGLMKKFGYSEAKAKFIEKSHLNLYNVYYSYVDSKLDQAETTGFVRLAFGLKLRTPTIKAGVLGGADKSDIEQERRSAGNALFQSYGMLTLRAFSTFMREVWNHKEYCVKVFPVITIYDSIYLDIPNDLECVDWVNKHLISAMENIDGCPELDHPQVKLGAELEVCITSWADTITLPNKASQEAIHNLLNKD